MRILSASVFFVMMLLSGGRDAGSQAAEIDDIVAHLQARYDSTVGFRADFTQEVVSATLGQKVDSHGQVFFKKPGRMRWEFQEPQQTLVSDGLFFWLYQPAEKQVIKTPFRQVFSSSTPVSFLTGVGRLDADFLISLSGKTDSVYQLRLTPKQDADAIGLLDLEVTVDTFDIQQATVTDPLGNITRLRFSNIDREANLADELFLFLVPPGVDVVEALPSS